MSPRARRRTLRARRARRHDRRHGRRPCPRRRRPVTQFVHYPESDAPDPDRAFSDSAFADPAFTDPPRPPRRSPLDALLRDPRRRALLLGSIAALLLLAIAGLWYGDPTNRAR